MNPSHTERRARLIAQMQQRGGGIAIIATAREVARNSDADYPYRHDSYFYYLSGFKEPEAVLVLVAGVDGAARSILFVATRMRNAKSGMGFATGPTLHGRHSASMKHSVSTRSIAPCRR